MLSLSANSKTPREENYLKLEHSIDTVSSQNSYEKLSGWKLGDLKFQETTCCKNPRRTEEFKKQV